MGLELCNNSRAPVPLMVFVDMKTKICRIVSRISILDDDIMISCVYIYI